MKVLSDINVSGKRIFVRADLDVPIKLTNDQGPDSVVASTGRLVAEAAKAQVTAKENNSSA